MWVIFTKKWTGSSHLLNLSIHITDVFRFYFTEHSSTFSIFPKFWCQFDICIRIVKTYTKNKKRWDDQKKGRQYFYNDCYSFFFKFCCNFDICIHIVKTYTKNEPRWDDHNKRKIGQDNSVYIRHLRPDVIFNIYLNFFLFFFVKKERFHSAGLKKKNFK